jgi:ABC-type branched-subunit amino acid transport system substrate-binding protein
MRISKKILVTMLVPLLAVFLVATDGLAQKKGFDDKEIRIGSWSPQTGPAAPWGATSRGAKLLFDMVNEEGGIHGRQIRLFIRDDQYNPSQTMAGVRDLVDRQGVLAFVGGVGTAPALAVRRYLAQNKIPLVGVMTGAEMLHVPHNPWLWGMWPMYDDDGSVMAQFVVQKLKAKKIGMLYQNDDYGLDPLAAVQRRLKTYNMELAIVVPVEPIERDLSSQISRLKAAGCDVVIGYVAPTQAAIALRNAVSVDFRPQWIHSYNLTDFVLMNHITDGLWAKEGVMTSAFTDDIFDFSIPKMKEYADAAKRLAPGERWGMFYAAGIAAAEPMVHALRLAGRDLSTEALVKALNSMNDFKGIGPRVSWSEKSHLPPAEFRVWQCGPKGEVKVIQDWTKNDLPKKR